MNTGHAEIQQSPESESTQCVQQTGQCWLKNRNQVDEDVDRSHIMQNFVATPENCVEVPQRVKTRPALRPSNCTAGDLPERHRYSEILGHMHLDVYSNNVHNSQTVEGDSVSFER